MSYQNGTASSAIDLLQQLVTWLVGIGWTQDRSAAEGSGWTASLHKSGNYAHLRAAMNESAVWHDNYGPAFYGLNLFLGTGFTGGQTWINQTAGVATPSGSSYPVGVGMRLNAGPFTNCYFFADAAGDNVVVVVEVTPGLFVHLAWGLSLEKAGGWTGGPYFFGSTASYYMGYSAGANIPGFTSTSDCPGVDKDGIGAGCGFVRADVDAWTGKWVSIYENASGPIYGYTGKQGGSSVRPINGNMSMHFPVYAYTAAANQFQQMQTSAQDGRANLLPVLLWVVRDGTTTGFSLLGSLPNVFFTNAVGNGFSNAQEYAIGATTYKVFPNFAVVKQ